MNSNVFKFETQNKNLCLYETADINRIDSKNGIFLVKKISDKNKISPESINSESSANSFEIINVKPSNNSSSNNIITINAPENNISRIDNNQEDIRKQLDEQIKVNAELKNLLVASVGNTLMSKLEGMVEERCKTVLDDKETSNNPEIPLPDGLSMSNFEDIVENFGALCRSYQTKYLAAKIMTQKMANKRQESDELYRQILTALNNEICEKTAIKQSVSMIYNIVTRMTNNSDSTLHALPNIPPINDSHLLETCQNIIVLLNRFCLQNNINITPPYMNTNYSETIPNPHTPSIFNNSASDNELQKIITQLQNLLSVNFTAESYSQNIAVDEKTGTSNKKSVSSKNSPRIQIL